VWFHQTHSFIIMEVFSNGCGFGDVAMDMKSRPLKAALKENGFRFMLCSRMP
jgi:hypothetical protein